VAEAAETAANHAAREKLYADTRGGVLRLQQEQARTLIATPPSATCALPLPARECSAARSTSTSNALQQRAYDTGFLDIGNNAERA